VRLGALEFLLGHAMSLLLTRAHLGDRTRDLVLTKDVLYQLS
jgi:hypothetical protein